MSEAPEDDDLPPKNVPKFIWLQVGDDVGPDDDFNDLDEVSWCVHGIYSTDIGYRLASEPPPRLAQPTHSGIWAYRYNKTDRGVDALDRIDGQWFTLDGVSAPEVFGVDTCRDFQWLGPLHET